MAIPQSLWTISRPAKKLAHRILFLPDDGVVLHLQENASKPGVMDVWGCWYLEDPGGVIHTTIRNGKSWKRESYQLHHGELHWEAGGYITVWKRLADKEFTTEWREYAARFVEYMNEVPPPAPPSTGGRIG